ncbi:GRAS family protein RAM1 [Linum perenne]
MFPEHKELRQCWLPQDDHHFHPTETVLSLSSSTSNDLLTISNSVKNSLIHDQRTSAFTSALEQEPPTLDIIRIAAVAFINSSSDEAFKLPPFNEEVNKKVTLLQLLLNAAEEVGRCNYDQAISLLELCNSLSSRTGNLTQRLVHCYSQALCQRVCNKSGKHISSLVQSSEKLTSREAISAPSPIVGVIYSKIPFYQVRQLAGVQAVVDNVEKAKRIHVIDLKITNGMQWTALMQSLASRKKGGLVILKLTAILTSASEKSVLEAGERLSKFAESMSIPFTFKTVAVPNMIEIHENQFDLDPKDVVAVFSENALHEFIQTPSELEALMGVIRKIRPKVMVVTEREANFNSLNFAQRFVEVLFHYGAYFDCIDACLDTDDENKIVLESMFLRDEVNACLVKEGKEMKRTATIEEKREMTRNVTVDVWRRFFGRFWMVEGGLSTKAMDTVDVLVSRFKGERCFCTVDMNGRSLVVGWKGVSIFSLSTWKFLLAKPMKRGNKHKQMQINVTSGFGLQQL